MIKCTAVVPYRQLTVTMHMHRRRRHIASHGPAERDYPAAAHPRATLVAIQLRMRDEAVTASSAPGDTSGRYLPYESADLYGDLSGGYYLADLTLERRLVEGFVRGSIIRLFLTSP